MVFCGFQCASLDQTDDALNMDIVEIFNQSDVGLEATAIAKAAAPAVAETAAKLEPERGDEEARKEPERKDDEKCRIDEAEAKATPETAAAPAAAETAAKIEQEQGDEEARKEQERKDDERCGKDEAEAKATAETAAAAIDVEAKPKEEERNQAVAQQQVDDEKPESEAKEEEAAAKAKLDIWLQANSCKDVSQKKKSMLKSFYPIHIAASKGDCDAMRLLLRFKADINQKNSSGQTALQVATKSNKKSSHEPVISMLKLQ